MKLTSLLLGFIVFLIPEIKIINLPIIGRTLEFSSKASAQIVQDYVPPVGSKKTSRTKGAGSRGCDRTSDTDLQLLTPEDHIATTVSARPTFFWSISNTSLPVRFTLIEPGVANPIMDRTFMVTRPGVVDVKLPSDRPGLTLGKEYRWTVSIICNEKRPSENTYAYSWIKRVAVTPKLAQNLVGVDERPQRSLVYARSGIWYEALISSFADYKAHPQNKIALWYFSRLLAGVGISFTGKQLQPGNVVVNPQAYVINK